MFRLRLHPSPLGLLSGIAVIAFWALLWLSVIVQLHQPRTDGGQSDGGAAVARAEGPGNPWTTF
jgi:hypothetical protein